MQRLLCSILAFGGGLGLSSAAFADDASETRELAALIKFVDDASELVRAEGAAALPKFRELGGAWYRGDRYVFVNDLKGTILVCPPEPQLEGQSEVALPDPDDRQPVAVIQAAVAGPEHAGWAHYRWVKPGHKQPVWKSSYVERVTGPDGRVYIIGSGIYPKRVYREFVIDTVDRAAQLIADRGQQAFAVLGDKTGPFYYQDTYVFVFDKDGTEVVNPAFPENVGRNALDMTDVDAKYPGQEMFDLLKFADFGWVDYKWPRPGEAEAVSKSAYVRKVQTTGETYVVGAGIYRD